MSELQIGLLIIGVVVVAGVYGYGFWQQRQYRRKFGATFEAQHDDALYHPPSAAADVLIEEEVAALDYEETHHQVGDDEVCALLDAATDYIVDIKLKAPLGSDALASLWAQRFDFGKRINACGLNAESGHWERLIPESHPQYKAFRIGLQLADRSGPVSEVRLKEFHGILHEIARQVDADIVAPDLPAALLQAKALDDFCADVDQMIGLNILPGGDRQLFASEIAKVGERYGLRLQADGNFQLVDGRGVTVFSLGSMDGTLFQPLTLKQTRVPGVTLLLDVPRVEQPIERFDELAELARSLATDLRAALVDDNRVTLSDKALGHIREQVASIQGRMLAGQVVPGSAQALRLFA